MPSNGRCRVPDEGVEPPDRSLSADVWEAVRGGSRPTRKPPLNCCGRNVMAFKPQPCHATRA